MPKLGLPILALSIFSFSPARRTMFGEILSTIFERTNQQHNPLEKVEENLHNDVVMNAATSWEDRDFACGAIYMSGPEGWADLWWMCRDCGQSDIIQRLN